MLFYFAGAVVVGEVSVGYAGKVEVFTVVVACYFAAAPAVVDGCFAAAAAPSDEGATLAAAFDCTCAEAVLDE